jgi:hypothetical protein
MPFLFRLLATCGALYLLATVYFDADETVTPVRPASVTDALGSPGTLSLATRVVKSNPIAPIASLPPTRSTPSQPPRLAEQRWVTVQRLNVRRGPSTSTAVVAAIDQGTPLTVLERRGGWIHAALQGGSEGWVAERYTSITKPAPSAAKTLASRADGATHVVPSARDLPERNRAMDRIIARSISDYPGNCPCPYNTDRAGRRCGGRSAYSRPGGRAPICYREDVTEAMLRRYR